MNICFRLPYPTPPPFELLWDVLFDAVTIAIVSYSVTMSMALIFAQKLHYKVDSNQELLAQVNCCPGFCLHEGLFSGRCPNYLFEIEHIYLMIYVYT